jgi:hypothetical protein
MKATIVLQTVFTLLVWGMFYVLRREHQAGSKVATHSVVLFWLGSMLASTAVTAVGFVVIIWLFFFG